MNKDEAIKVLRDVVEHMEWSTQQGKTAYESACKLLAVTADIAPEQPSAPQLHMLALKIVQEEAGRTLSKKDFDLCMRIARRALGLADDAARAAQEKTNG